MLDLTLGLNFLKGRREDKLNRRVRNADRIAAVSEALVPGRGFRPGVDVPKASFLEKAATAGSLGLNALDQARLADAQTRNVQARTAKIGRDFQTQDITDDILDKELKAKTRGNLIGAGTDAFSGTLPGAGGRVGPEATGFVQGSRAAEDAARARETHTQATELHPLRKQLTEAQIDSLEASAWARDAASTAAVDEAARARRVSTLMASAVKEARDNPGGADAAARLFMQQVEGEGLGLTLEDFDDFGETLAASVPNLKLSGENASFVARRAAIEDSLQRIREAIHAAPQEQFDAFQSQLDFMKDTWMQGRMSETDARNLLGMIGLSSEMTVRVFSGAAITKDEFERFSTNFIGDPRGGREALLGRLNIIENDFRSQREQMLQAIRDPEGMKVGIDNATDEQLIDWAERGDPAAESELRRRPSALRLLEEMNNRNKPSLIGGLGRFRGTMMPDYMEQR
tara:strand:+ start:241 stop:1614 length:1374 start_codon:yes stop_codon:yes gene_type:complete